MTSARRNLWLGCALIAAAVLGIYGPGLHNALIFDDARLTDGTIFGPYGSLLKLQPRMLSYGSFVWLQPLLGDGYAGQRVVNVLLHLGTSVAIYALLRRLLGLIEFTGPADAAADAERARRAALIVAVGLFAVHPVAVYGVAYLIQRSIVMATLFSALSCLAFVHALQKKSPLWAVVAVATYALAVMSKEHAIMIAGVWVGLYVYVARPPWQRLLALSAVALAVLLAVAYLLTQRYGSIVGAATFDETSAGYLKQLEGLAPGISARVYPLSALNEAALFWRYGLLWALPNPHWLAIDLRPAFPLSFGSLPHLAGAGALLLACGFAIWALLRRRDVWAWVALCFLSAVALFLTELVTSWVQDPFVLYRSYLWAFMAPGLLAAALMGLRSRTIYAIGIVLGLGLSALAWERVQSLRDDFTAWSDAVDKVDLDAPANAVGRWRPFLNRGAYFLQREDPQHALDDFAIAVTLGEPMGSAQFNHGAALQLLKRHPEAIAAFNAAEAMGFKEASLYYQRADSFKASGRFKEAFDNYSAALAAQRTDELRQFTRVKRAEVALPAREFATAIADFQELLRAKPDEPRYQVGLGVAQIGAGQTAEALALFNQMLARQPSGPAYYGRALAHNARGDKAAALRDLDQATALEPGNPMYRRLRTQLEAANTPAAAATPAQPVVAR